MRPEKGKKYAIGYVGEFGYDGWCGVAVHTGEIEVEEGDGELFVLFEFEISDGRQELAYFPEQSILAEVK